MAKKYASKFYFAVNKIDTISQSELEVYLRYCNEFLCKNMEIESLDLFPISARKAAGIEEILKAIRQDVRTSRDDILVKSVGIKLGETLSEALSQIRLYMISLLNKQIDELKAYLKDIIFTLFGIEYYYDKTTHTLSRSEDFYVSVNWVSGNFFIDIRDYVYLMPRGYGNKIVYERYLKKMEEDINRNLTNMIYNYKYKIRESLRTFNSYIIEESEMLKQSINDLMARVIAERENAHFELEEKLKALNEICIQLNQITVRFNK